MTQHPSTGSVGLLLVAPLLAFAPNVWAQGGSFNTASSPVPQAVSLWNRVKSGDTVTVTDSSARETSGVLAKLSDAALTVMVDGALRDIPMTDIRVVTKLGGDSLWNGLLVGLGTGVAIGIVDVTTPCPTTGFGCVDYTHESGGTKAAVATGDTLIFGGIGVLIDYLHKGRTVVYRAPASSRVALRPTIGAHRAGLQAAVDLR